VAESRLLSNRLTVRHWLGCGLVFLTLPSIWACHRVTATPASRCILVDLLQKEGVKALPKLDVFSSSHGLVADRSHWTGPQYQLLDHGQLVAEISYRMGMGEFGANLAFFSYSPEKSSQLLDSFDSFVEGDLSKAFSTRRCSDVPGYANPITYR